VTRPWTTSTALRFRDFDYLGHMTATSYLALVEEARVDWLSADASDLPSYVVAEQNLVFRREVLRTDGPLSIAVTGRIVSADRFEVEEQITGSTGHVHATSRAVLVAWDRDRRRPRDLTDRERALVEGRPSAGPVIPDDGSVHEAPSRQGDP